MKHGIRRLGGLALALCLSLSLLPAGAAAAEGDTQRGVITYSPLIDPQYEDANSFSDGLAAVKKDGKWGYIDTDGNTVIDFKYALAYEFNEDRAVVGTLLGQYDETHMDWRDVGEDQVEVTTTYYYIELGMIDQAGNYTPFILPNGVWNPLTEEYQEGPSNYTYTTDTLDFRSGSRVFYNGYLYLPDPEEPGGHLYDIDGQMVTLALPEDSMRTPDGWQVAEGYTVIGIYEDQAYYNMSTGATLEIPWPEDAEFMNLRPMNQGMAPVGVAVGTMEEDYWILKNRWGFVNSAGQWVIQPTYSDFMVSDIYRQYVVFGVTGLAMVKDAATGKWGAIDKAGKTVIPFQYDGLRPYSFGLAAFCQNGKYGYLDGEGNVAIAAQYELTSGFGGSGYAAAYDGQRAFLIDSKGNEVPGADKLDPDTYFTVEENGNLSTHTPGSLVVIQEDGKYGYGKISYMPPLPTAADMDSWALPEVTAAIEENLVPNYLQNLYLNDITRGEFCDLVVQAISEVLDQDIEDIVQAQTNKSLSAWAGEYPFIDTSDSNVVASYALGIVSGRGGGIFDPYAKITRQEAAKLLMNSAKVLGMDITASTPAGFTDGDQVAVWFTDAVNFVHQINVMSGVGGGGFAPLGTYTREQSYVTIYRLFLAITQG